MAQWGMPKVSLIRTVRFQPITFCAKEDAV
jgi:hypothetical protein